MKKITSLLLIAFMMVGMTAIDAQAQKKLHKAGAKKGAKAKIFNANDFTGVFVNSFKDYDGNLVNDTIALLYNASTGEVTGNYCNESGTVRDVAGMVDGKKVALSFIDNGDELAEAFFFYNKNSLKLDGFTGLFKRISSTYKEIKRYDLEEQHSVEPSKTLEEAADAVRQAAAAGQVEPTE